jgi:very-short-patch-repair endonuclease
MPTSRPHVSDRTRSQARRLRKKMTPAEKELWAKLRDHRMFGVKFRRQCPIGTFIVDFCCPACKLIVEIDGDTHADTVLEDVERTRQLQALEYRVVRFANSDVHRNLDGVLESILKEVKSTTPAP